MENNRDFPEWFKKIINIEGLKTDNLPVFSTYGKGIRSFFNLTPSFGTLPVEYVIKDIDKELELYTLKEASETEGISNLLNNILSNPLALEQKIKFDALSFASINSGLFVYVQPKIDDNGNLLAHEINLETIIKDGIYSDLLVIVVKAGAKCKINHFLKGGEADSVLGRRIFAVCEDGSSLVFEDRVEGVKGYLSLNYNFIIGPDSSSHLISSINSDIKARQICNFKQIGIGATASFEGMFIASNDSKYDISVLSDIKNESCHTSITTGGVARDNSKIIYRSGVISSHEENSNIDESKLLIVGESAEINSLPVEGSNNIRHDSISYLDSADEEDVTVFLNRILQNSSFKM